MGGDVTTAPRGRAGRTTPSRLDDHPTARAIRAARQQQPAGPPPALDADRLRRLCLDAGADDVGFVEIERPALADQRADIDAALPGARALISIVCRTNRDAIRSPARSISNLEFHHGNRDTDEVARRVVAALERDGVRALNPAVGFPMEMPRWPGKIWVVGHKPVAVEAGLGKMGIHRNVIHPRFGNFILLSTVVVDTAISSYGRPLDFNPCLECKLCVAACPTGAISKTGEFDFSACATHNYREFLTGFGDWIDTVADSADSADYRRKVTDPETVSVWQSLAFGPNYKAAYCVAVCPAGEDVLGPYLDDRRAHLDTVVRPLQDKVETVYVLDGGDPEEFVPRRFPHKTTRTVHLGIRPASIDGFATGLPLVFQRRPAAGLDAVYHLVFTGSEQRTITVIIRDQRLDVRDGLHDRPDLTLRADADTWLRYLAGRARLLPALLTGRFRIRGDPRLLARFGRCFPS
jgi:ferredoxin